MKTVLLGDVAQIISGQSPSSSHYNQEGDGLPLYQGKKDFGALFTAEPTVWTTETTKVAETGDILISVRAPVGPVNFASQKMNIGRGLAAIRPWEGLDSNYLFYFLQYSEPQIIKLAGGATFQSINRTHLKNLIIPYPDIEEQRRVVKRLDEVFGKVDKAIELTQKNLQNSQELFRAESSIIFSRENSSWTKAVLGELYIIERGGSPRPIKDYLTDKPAGINWIKIGDVKPGARYITQTKEKIKPEGMKKSRLVKEGDFVLSNSMSFGRPYIMKTTGCIHDGWLLIRAKGDEITNDFLYHFLSSNHAYSQFDRAAAGSTVRNLNTGLVRKVKVHYPTSHGEQEKIVQKLDTLAAQTQKLQELYRQKLANLQELKQSYLKQAFEGRL